MPTTMKAPTQLPEVLPSEDVATPLPVPPALQVVRPASPKFTFSLKRADEHDLWLKMLVYGQFGSGKCAASSDYITLADGAHVQFGSLIDTQFALKTIVGGRHETVQARAEFNALEEVFDVITESGRRIRRNAAHPLYVATIPAHRPGVRPAPAVESWKPVGRLSGSDFVAVPTILSIDAPQALPEHEIKLIAYLIGDGGLTQPLVYFCQPPGKQLEEFRSCAEAIGCAIVTNDNGRHHRVKAAVRAKRPSPMVFLMREHGLMGHGSATKRIPSAIFRLGNAQLGVFLSRLFATEGWAYTGKSKKASQIGYSSISRGLVEDIQELLLRFGICSKIRTRRTRTNFTPVSSKEGTISHELTIALGGDILRFVREIGMYGKEEALERVREQAEGKEFIHSWRTTSAPAGTRWERVATVTSAGVEPTVAVCVPGVETYLTTFYEHNTKFASSAVDVPAMRDVLFLDAEGGSMTISNLGDAIDIVPIKDFEALDQVKQFLILHCQRRDRGDVEGMRSLEEQLRGVKVEVPKQYRTVVIDSISELGKMMMARLLGVSPDTSNLDAQIEDATYSHWGQASQRIQLMVRAFRSIPIHVVFVASEKMKEDERKQQRIMLNLSGQLANDVQGFLDVVGYLVSLPGANGVQVRRMFLQPGVWAGASFNAKHRFSGINVAHLDDPTMSDIYELLQMMKGNM